VLPASIAARLKAGEGVIADAFPDVTVLFADIVNFTRRSRQISPAQVVATLNDLFSAFDQLAQRHGLEKIRTIGDAYMVAGGLPDPRPDHAEAVADMALAMQVEIARHTDPSGQPLAVRIGIDTGLVEAGVIGTSKFSYDLWGDTVNTASRMESHGIAGCIQVTERTYQRLRDSYRFEPRGQIPVRGLGAMTTSRRRMWSSPWGVGMSVRSIRASAMRTGSSQDPAGQPVEVVRRIRNDIDGRVQRLLGELVPAGA
jgi:adenylate cyclase